MSLSLSSRPSSLEAAERKSSSESISTELEMVVTGVGGVEATILFLWLDSERAEVDDVIFASAAVRFRVVGAMVPAFPGIH